jgi:predicted membrane chloride channel (bestrophin family)
MIPLEKGYLGLATIFQVHGSSLPRALIPALYSFAVTMLMFYVPTSHGDMQWRHYFMLLMPDWKAFQIFGSITMFLLVFRTQLSYSRYWEGVGKVQVRAHARLSCFTRVGIPAQLTCAPNTRA